MNYGKLQGRIKELGLTQKSLAHEIGMSEYLLCNKLKGRAPMKQEDMVSLATALGIAKSEYGDYFFTPKVAITEQHKGGT